MILSCRQNECLSFYNGMKVSLARKMSHRVKLLPYNNALYGKMHNYVFKLLRSFSPIIEPSVFGQYYVDMTGTDGLYKNPFRAGYLISKDINKRADLNNRVGISINKLVSNISTAVVQERINKIDKGNEPNFLAPLASQILPSSHDVNVQKILRFLYLERVKEIQEITSRTDIAKTLFGNNYKRISLEANGKDNSIVQPPKMRDHIIRQTILKEDTNDEEILDAVVTSLAEQLAYYLRKRRQISQSVTVEVHYTDGFKKVRKGSIFFNDDETVCEVCRNLFVKANYRRNRVRTVIIDATKFQAASYQLTMFEQPKIDELSRTLDKIRNKYGFACIKTASEMMIKTGTKRMEGLVLDV